MATGPDISQHLRERADFYDKLTPTEMKAFDEVKAFVEKTTDNLQSKQRESVGEANEYERQYTSFFGLAISFIVAGLLSSPPIPASTFANRLFYTGAIITASVAAVFLFFEYRTVSKHFDKWIKGANEAMKYVASGDWRTPGELNQWIDAQQAAIPEKSTKVTQVIEVILVGSAFVMLTMWLIEALFNPNWPIF